MDSQDTSGPTHPSGWYFDDAPIYPTYPMFDVPHIIYQDRKCGGDQSMYAHPALNPSRFSNTSYSPRTVYPERKATYAFRASDHAPSAPYVPRRDSDVDFSRGQSGRSSGRDYERRRSRPQRDERYYRRDDDRRPRPESHEYPQTPHPDSQGGLGVQDDPAMSMNPGRPSSITSNPAFASGSPHQPPGGVVAHDFAYQQPAEDFPDPTYGGPPEGHSQWNINVQSPSHADDHSQFGPDGNNAGGAFDQWHRSSHGSGGSRGSRADLGQGEVEDNRYEMGWNGGEPTGSHRNSKWA